MTSKPGVFKRQPLLTTAGLAAVVAPVLTALIAFGVPLTADQQSAVSGLVAVLGPVVVALVGHLTGLPIGDLAESGTDPVNEPPAPAEPAPVTPDPAPAAPAVPEPRPPSE